MDYVFFFALIPIAISLVAKYGFKMDISWIELAVQACGAFVLLLIVWVIAANVNRTDIEIINGAVTNKEVRRERCYTNMSPTICQNSYSCNCVTICVPVTTTSGNTTTTTQSCTTTCDTCYSYPWEQDWYVFTNIDKTYTISRVDPQGAGRPPRWDRVEIGDPVSRRGRFTNWIKNASRSLFRESRGSVEQYRERELLPDYPSEITDYYRIDRVLTPNLRLRNEAAWNAALSDTLSRLGPTREMNAILVFVRGVPRDYAFALRSHWRGFKQNEAVIVIGLDGSTVQWAEVLSWSKNAAFDSEAKRVFESYIGTPITALSPTRVMSEFEQTGTYFERRPMEEYEYLKDDQDVSPGLIWVIAIFSLVYGFGTAYLFSVIDISSNTTYSSYRPYRSFMK